MGIYNRDYYSEEPRIRFVSPLGPSWKTSAVTWIIGINVAIWLLQVITRGGLTALLYCPPDKVVGGWQFWRLLTAAFCHSEVQLSHIFFNMLMLFFFGAPIEKLYGKKDFVAFYLTVAIGANLVHVLLAYSMQSIPVSIPVLGASGCGVALVVLCALYYPHRTVILFIFPIPLWLLGVLLVGSDLVLAVSQVQTDKAYIVHLAGAGFGVLYKFVDLRWSTLTSGFRKWKFERRAKRAFQKRSTEKSASDGIPRFTEDVENQRLDRLLEKIHRFGKESLTDEEQQFLELMSKRYKKGRT